MTSQEFQQHQQALGLKNRDLERLFEVSDQTVINWRMGHTRVPGAVAWAIRNMVDRATAAKPDV